MLLPGRGLLLQGEAFSGSAGRPFIVQGAGQGTTVLSGGVRVTGWKQTKLVDGTTTAWQANLPPNTTYFRQLFVTTSASSFSNLSTSHSGGGFSFSRRHTARSPVMMYDHADMANPKYAIVFKRGQVLGSYHNQEDVLATLYHCWTATTHRIHAINATNLTLTLLQVRY